MTLRELCLNVCTFSAALVALCFPVLPRASLCFPVLFCAHACRSHGSKETRKTQTMFLARPHSQHPEQRRQHSTRHSRLGPWASEPWGSWSLFTPLHTSTFTLVYTTLRTSAYGNVFSTCQTGGPNGHELCPKRRGHGLDPMDPVNSMELLCHVLLDESPDGLDEGGCTSKLLDEQPGFTFHSGDGP